MDVDQRIKELLLDEETRIPGIPQFWREHCFEAARLLHSRDALGYLLSCLDPLALHYRTAVITTDLLRAYCEVLEAAKSFAEISATQGVTQPTSHQEVAVWFLLTAESTRSSHHACAAFAACQLTLPQAPATHLAGSTSVAYFLLGHSLSRCDRGRQAAGLLESHLDISCKHYKSPEVLQRTLEHAHVSATLPNAAFGSDYVIELAEALSTPSSGRAADAVALLDAHFGLDATVNNDAAAVRAWLNSADLAAKLPNPDRRSSCFLTWSDALHFAPARSAHESTTLLEQHLGLSPPEYRDACRLRERLADADFIAKLPDISLQASYLSALADGLCDARATGSSDAIMLLEAFAGLGAALYDDPGLVRNHLTSTDFENRFSHASDRASLLLALSRAHIAGVEPNYAKSTLLLESYVGLDVDTYASPQRLLQWLLKNESELKLPGLDERADFFRTLAASLKMTVARGPQHSAALLMAYAGLQESHFRDAELLRSQLCTPTSSLSKAGVLSRAAFIIELANVLTVLPERRSIRAVALLEAYIGLSEEDYSDPIVLEEKLEHNEFTKEATANQNYAAFIAVLAGALLRAAGRGPTYSIALVEAFVGLSKEDYYESYRLQRVLFSGKVDRRLPDALSRANCLLSLANAMIYSPTRGVAGAINLLEFYTGILRSDYRSTELLGAKIRGNRFRSTLPTSLSRTSFVSTLARALELEPQSGAKKAAQLIGAFLTTSSQNIIESPELGADPPVNRLGLMQVYLRCIGSEHPLTLTLCHDVVRFLLTVRDAGLPSYSHKEEFFGIAQRVWPSLLMRALECRDNERLESWPRKGVGIDHSIALWSEHFLNRLLVERIFLEPEEAVEGCVSLSGWSAWQPRLDRKPLRLWLDQESRGPLGGLRFHETASRPAPSVPAGEPSTLLDRDALLGRDYTLEELVPQRCVYLRVLFDDDSLESKLRWWLWRHGDDGLELIDEGFSKAGARGRLEQAIGGFDAKINGYYDQVVSADDCDGAFGSLVEVLNESFEDSVLGNKIASVSLAGDDVVFHVEGPLLTTPLAWLECQDGPLWKCARSTSSVVSLTLRKVSEQFNQQPNRRILNAHWDTSDQKFLNEMRALRFQLDEVAKGWELWSLGEPDDLEWYGYSDGRPHTCLTATADRLASALSSKDHRFGVVVVNAHGSVEEGGGVALAPSEEGHGDSRWRGDGADLRHTDLLVLACCSVGRLSDGSAQEVEGLYARLAANRARTVVTARWPVDAAQTAYFVRELVGRYTEAVDQCDDPLKPFEKARSFANARRELLHGNPHRCLQQTLAAFELYGIA